MNTKNFLNIVAGNVFGSKKDTPIPDKYYIGLSTSAPSEDGSGATEPVEMGYKRVEITGLTEPADGVVKNGAALDFPESTGEWGLITHYVIYGQETGGDLLIYGDLTNPKTVESETIVSIKANELELSVVNCEAA